MAFVSISSFAISLLVLSTSSSVDAVKFMAAGTMFCSTLEKPPGQSEPLPVPWATVQMWEDDGNWTAYGVPLDPDDAISAEQKTTNGSFNVQGEENELGEEKPYLLVKHSCRPKESPKEVLESGCSYASKIDLQKLYKDLGQDSTNDFLKVEDLKIVLGDDSSTAGGKKHEVKTSKQCK